ncbi:MAG: glycosyltransferase, partial [bacterium]|nr:glycosyltransferase [bacterium]
VFVGDGEEMAEMKELSTHLSVGDRITFLGARNDVYDILRAGDVCLLSSRWEGLPIVLIEAGLLKIPVVASNTYGNREIIKENCGHLFKNLDSKALAAAISDTLDNRFDLSSFANRLHKEVVENYNLEKMLSGLRNIYNDVS